MVAAIGAGGVGAAGEGSGAATTSFGSHLSRRTALRLSSMRGKSGVDCRGASAGRSVPKASSDGQRASRSATFAPSQPSRAAAVAGRTGATRSRVHHSAAASVWSTCSSSGCFAGSLASDQGSVAAMYVLASRTRRHTASSAREGWKPSSAMRASRTASAATRARFAWAPVPASAASRVPTPPAPYFTSIVRLRLMRLPRSLARSAL